MSVDENNDRKDPRLQKQETHQSSVPACQEHDLHQQKKQQMQQQQQQLQQQQGEGTR
jgi:hypothetical protein